MANLSELRQQYPQYNDMSDQDLADSFHNKYYSDIPKDEFYAKVGYTPQSTPAKFGNFSKGLLSGVMDTAKSYTDPMANAGQDFKTAAKFIPGMGGPTGENLVKTAENVSHYIPGVQKQLGDDKDPNYSAGRDVGYYGSQYGPSVYGLGKAAASGVGKGIQKLVAGNPEEIAKNEAAMKAVGIENPSPLSASGNQKGQQAASLLSRWFPGAGGKKAYLKQNEQLEAAGKQFSEKVGQYPNESELYGQVSGLPVDAVKGRGKAQELLAQINKIEKAGGTVSPQVKNQLNNFIANGKGDFSTLQGIKSTFKDTSLPPYEAGLVSQVSGGITDDLYDAANAAGKGDVFKQANQAHQQKMASEIVNKHIESSTKNGELNTATFLNKLSKDKKLEGLLSGDLLEQLKNLKTSGNAMGWQLKNMKPGINPYDALTAGSIIGGSGLLSTLMGASPLTPAVGIGAVKGASKFLNSKAAGNLSKKAPIKIKGLNLLGTAAPGLYPKENKNKNSN